MVGRGQCCEANPITPARASRHSRSTRAIMPQRQPNLLLITTDQQRADALSLNGSSTLATPNLDIPRNQRFKLSPRVRGRSFVYPDSPHTYPPNRGSDCTSRIELDGSKAQRDLGITYTSIDDGIDATLDWLHDTGLMDLPEDDDTDAGPSAGDESA